MKKNVLTFALLFGTHLLFAQISGLQIRSENTAPIDYCSGTVALGDHVSIQGADISGGIKVSITNYIRGEDQLSFETTTKISGRWDDQTGSLILSGIASAADYQEAVRNIKYTNLAASPTKTTRSVAVSLSDVDYLPSTGHFYKYYRSIGISWTSAKVEAERKNYYGLQGYLATILSKEENDFIWDKTHGFGWIGANDSEVEGDWRWVTGPEAGTLFWRGTYGNGYVIHGLFSFWSRGEPNNAYTDLNGGIGEDYAHINQDPGKEPKSWNDLRNEGDGSTSLYYNPKGYIVEFGGMPGDPKISLSAVFKINFWDVHFDEDIEKTICQYDTVQLNHESFGNYEWYPKTGLDDPYRSNPLASPMDTTVYKVVSRNGECADSAFFTVNVKPGPVVDFGGDRDICEGTTTSLDAGSHSSYQWNTGSDQQILETGEPGIYQVQVSNEFNCFASGKVEVKVHSYPKIDLSHTDTIFCDAMEGTVKAVVDNGQVEWEPSTGLSFDSPISAQTTARVNAYGTYKSRLKVTDQYGCQSSDSLNLSFHKTPTSDFSIDSTQCYGYNLKVHYEGDGSSNALYNWVFLDTVYAAGVGLTDLTVNLGFDKTEDRKLGLTVNEGGCVSPVLWKHIKVVPNMSVNAVVDEGCEPFLTSFNAETTEPVSNFTWYFGDGDSLKTQAPQHTYQQDGIYDVGLRIISNEGCENYGVVKKMIIVHPIPTVETSIDPDSCYPHTFQVNYTGSANPQDTYHWDFSSLDGEEILQNPGTGQGPFELNLMKRPQASLGLQITTEFGCESPARQFGFKRKPWFHLSSDLDVGCPPLDVSLKAISQDSLDQLIYQWQFNHGEAYISGLNEISHRFDAPDHQFEVSAVATSSITGCADTVKLDSLITLYPKPTASFQASSNELSIINPVFSFQNLSENAQNYYWDFGDSIGLSAEFEPTYRYHKIGWYNVGLLVENEYLCTDTAYQRLLVAFDKIFPPNAFNPNSSNPTNRTFLLATEGVAKEGYHMQIFNRWGECIFEANNDFVPWDGKMKNGRFAPTGVYTWVLAYLDFVGRSHRQTGIVTLVY